MGWSFIQSATSVSSTSVTSYSQAFSSNVTAGDLLVVFLNEDPGAELSTITDTLSNTYSQVADFYESDGSRQISMWWAISKASGSCTVNASAAAASFIGLNILEFGTPGGTVSLDGSASSHASSASPSCGTIDVTGANELCVAAFNCYAGSRPAVSAGSGWTLEISGNNSGAESLVSSSPVNGTFSLSASNAWVSIGGSFSSTSIGGTTVYGAGSVSLAASATGQASAALTARGAVALAGSASAAPFLSLNARGSISLAGNFTGSGQVQQAGNLYGSGSVFLSSSAAATPALALPGKGAATLAGTASAQVSLLLSAKGALSLQGTAAAQLSQSLLGRGAMSLVGIASAQPNVLLAASAAVSLKGALAGSALLPAAVYGSGSVSLLGALAGCAAAIRLPAPDMVFVEPARSLGFVEPARSLSFEMGA